MTPSQQQQAEHPFVVWLVATHGEGETPLGHFSRTLSPYFPLSGERRDLRRFLEYNGGDAYTLMCFDVAWEQYRPTCMGYRCPEPAADGSSMCELHGLL